MKIEHIYVPCTVRTVAAVSSRVLCGSVRTDIPISTRDGDISVEETKQGFENTDGTDFKDLSFE